MPLGDRTGPSGLGARSGRGAGFCAGYGVPGYMNPGPSFGYGFRRGQEAGFGQGRGRGFRGRFCRQFSPWGYQYGAQQYAPVPGQFEPVDEKAYLASEAKILKEQLSSIEKRLSELGGSENKDQ